MLKLKRLLSAPKPKRVPIPAPDLKALERAERLRREAEWERTRGAQPPRPWCCR